MLLRLISREPLLVIMSKPTAKEPEKLPLDAILKKAGKRALGGGIPGAVAMAAQVVTLMPLRTTMNVSDWYHSLSSTRSVIMSSSRINAPAYSSDDVTVLNYECHYREWIAHGLPRSPFLTLYCVSALYLLNWLRIY